MPISFNQIPVNLRVPGAYIEIDNSRAVQGLLPMPHQVLMFGQKLPAGTATANEPILVTRAADAVGLFGRGSQLAHMVDVFKAANGFTDLYVLPMDDNGTGTKATRDITVDTQPTKSGTLNLYIGGRRIQVGITAGDTVDTVATAIADAVNADDDGFVTAAAATGTVTLTARHAGIDAGDIDVRHSYHQGELLPDGLTLTIAALTEGSGNPDISTVLDVLADEWYNTLVMPWTDSANLTALEAELEDRWGPQRMIEGHAFAGKTGTVSELSTFGDDRNSQFVTMADAGVTIAPPWLLAAADAGVDSAEPDPARPRQTLRLPATILPVPETERRIHSERNTLLHDGIATHKVVGGRVQVERLITMYQVNASDIEDTSFLDVTTMRTLAFLRWSTRARILSKFPRHKLADDGTPIAPGQAIVTPRVIRAELVSLFQDWQEIGLTEDIEQFKRDLIVERNGSDPNRLDALIPPDVVNQLRVFAGQIQFRL